MKFLEGTINVPWHSIRDMIQSGFLVLQGEVFIDQT